MESHELESNSASNLNCSLFVSMKPAVEFIDVQDQYSYNDDLHCIFKFNDYTPQEGDRVAIFKLGWSFVKDYIVFEWAPICSPLKQSVSFNKHVLPKNTTEIYQLCYISGENELHGASSPFQFTNEESINLQSFSSASGSTDLLPKSKTMDDSEKDKEILKLKEENAILRESLKALINQRNINANKSYDSDIKELRDITDSLKVAVISQQKELNLLKQKIKEGGEEYKKLYLEKVKVERKYENLKSKKEESSKVILESSDSIADLTFKSIPPFPFPIKN